jgi:sec-independent protein translocase protein TatC
MNQYPGSRKPFVDHLNELRSRLFFSGVFLVSASIIGYLVHGQILSLLIEPLHQTIFYTSPTGGFDLAFKASLLFGLMASLPFFMYQIVKFVEPAVPNHNIRIVLTFSFLSFFLLVLGVGFAYIIGLPATLKFLSSFSSSNIKPLITSDQYFSFVSIYLLSFGLLFQIPPSILLINVLRPLKPSTLIRKERYVIAISFIFGAAVAPTPDVISMSIMALPPIILYNLTIVIMFIIKKRRKRLSRVALR